MDQTPPPSPGAYQPVGVPAVAPHQPGMSQGIAGIVCGVVSLLIFPPVFGVIGIVLGILAIRKGEKTLGTIAVVLSSIFMIIGIGLGVYVQTHPELFRSSDSTAAGAVIEAVRR